MKSAASHFLTVQRTQDSVPDAASYDSQKKNMAAYCTRPPQENAISYPIRTSFPRISTGPRPVFIGPLLRAPRVSEAAVLLDGFPCEAVFFMGRVVRCEGPEHNGSASTTRPYTAMLLSDTTGIIAVMQYRTTVEATAAYSASHISGGDLGYSTTNERQMSSTETVFGFGGDSSGDLVYENDYVFVAGRLAFEETLKETQRVVQGAVEFVSGDVHKTTSEGRFCVRGTARVITDMNEIHYWALSALETHVRLLSITCLGPQSLHTARKSL